MSVSQEQYTYNIMSVSQEPYTYNIMSVSQERYTYIFILLRCEYDFHYSSIQSSIVKNMHFINAKLLHTLNNHLRT